MGLRQSVLLGDLKEVYYVNYDHSSSLNGTW